MDRLVDRRLVHKNRESNVLLANLRRMLPKSISPDEMDTLASRLNTEEKDALYSVYRLVESGGLLGDGPVYAHREILGVMKLSREQYEAVRISLNEDLAGHLDDHYGGECDAAGTRYLKKIPDDDLLNRIIKTADKREYYTDNSLQAEVSAIVEKGDAGYREEVYLANMVVETSHPFFFEHPNEHVPGIMLLEACRQMIIACGHQYGAVPLEGSHMILDVLEARFSGFLELYAPVVLRAELTRKKLHRGVWSFVSLDISIHQNGQKSGVVTCAGSNIGTGVFRRIRRMKRDELRSLPFIPADHRDYSLLIRTDPQSRWIEREVNLINLSGAEIKLGSGGELPESGACEFILLISGLGTANGSATLISAGSRGQRLVFGDEFESEALELFLKRSCKVPEEAVL